MIRAAFIVLLVLLTIHFGNSHSIKENSTFVSDGMYQTSQSSVLELGLTTTVTCTPVYFFLPCTTEIWGELFLVVVYEYFLSLAGVSVSKGADLFLKTFGTEVFGASLFQLLGLFPQLALVIVSAVSSSESTVESMATMGMGLLAGSVVMNLTLVWGSIVAFGNYNLSETSTSSTSKTTGSFSLTGYGVTTDVETTHTARLMMSSMLPFLLLQLAKILNSTSATRIVVLVTLIICLVSLICYCTYQAFEPWIQERRHELLMLRYVKKNLLQVLLTAEGKPNEPVIKELFRKIDKNIDAYVSHEELRALILGIQIQEVGSEGEELIEKVMEEFDTSDDSKISETEFVKGLSTWISKANVSAKQKKVSNSTSKTTTDEEQQSLLDVKTKKESKSEDKPWWNYTKATLLVILGTGISAVLAQPLMETLSDFSTSANIPSFLVSYVLIPLALNFRQALNSITSARQKTKNAVSLTLSETYDGVFLNNNMGLATFLLLVYIRNLTWDVSAEVLVVLIICTAMGIFGSLSTKFPVWTSIIAYLLYPISLLLIYLLTSVLGWS